MGRITENIKVNGKLYRAMFDSGSRNTYIIPEVAKNFFKVKLQSVFEVRLGGKSHRLTESVILIGKIQNKIFNTKSLIIDKIGFDDDGKEIQILLGALAMQEWGIKLDLQNEKLDMTHYSKEFLEF